MKLALGLRFANVALLNTRRSTMHTNVAKQSAWERGQSKEIPESGWERVHKVVWAKGTKIGARKGIPKNLSSQVLGEVRVNFLG